MKHKCRGTTGPKGAPPISGHVSSLHQDYLTHGAFCRKWDSSKVAKALAQSCYSSLGRGHEYLGLPSCRDSQALSGPELTLNDSEGTGTGSLWELALQVFSTLFLTHLGGQKRPSVQAIEHWLQEGLSWRTLPVVSAVLLVLPHLGQGVSCHGPLEWSSAVVQVCERSMLESMQEGFSRPLKKKLQRPLCS